jgi:hypothetical protein
MPLALCHFRQCSCCLWKGGYRLPAHDTARALDEDPTTNRRLRFIFVTTDNGLWMSVADGTDFFCFKSKCSESDARFPQDPLMQQLDAVLRETRRPTVGEMARQLLSR